MKVALDNNLRGKKEIKASKNYLNNILLKNKSLKLKTTLSLDDLSEDELLTGILNILKYKGV